MKQQSRKSTLTELDQNGLEKMRQLNKDYLEKNEASDKVRDYLTRVGEDEALMLIYLRGRKHRPDHAWATLKRRGEVQFDLFPEVYTSKPASFYDHFQDAEFWGVLKNKDKFGRTVICTSGGKWNPAKMPFADVTNAQLHFIEKFVFDDSTLENGIILVQSCEGMGLSYGKYLRLHDLRRLLNCAWHACPLKVKGIYFVYVPVYLTFLYALVRPFFSKKLKERFVLTTTSAKFETLHTILDPKILPSFLGGDLEFTEACDLVNFKEKPVISNNYNG